MKSHDLSQLQCVGITNQRETTVLWDRTTGQPLHNAIVWSDGRTAEIVNKLTAGKSKYRLRVRVWHGWVWQLCSEKGMCHTVQNV